MKVETVEGVFKPVRITLETQDEVDCLYALLNFSPIGDIIRRGSASPDWCVLYDKLSVYRSLNYSRYQDQLDKGLQRRVGSYYSV